jgi:hypothetical protein
LPNATAAFYFGNAVSRQAPVRSSTLFELLFEFELLLEFEFELLLELLLKFQFQLLLTPPSPIEQARAGVAVAKA